VQEKATIEDISAVREDMQKYALITSVRELRREILPEVRNMGVKIIHYQQENEQMKEMIRRFDEVISEKASKSALS
jgi:rRNA-processing protein FCF1